MRIVLSQFVMRVNKLRVISYHILSLLVYLLLLCNLFFQMYGDQLPHQLADFLTMLASSMITVNLLGSISLKNDLRCFKFSRILKILLNGN